MTQNQGKCKIIAVNHFFIFYVHEPRESPLTKLTAHRIP